MNPLVENGIISEMKCGNNFAYILNDSSLFQTTEYKVLQSQGDGLFIKCMRLLYNGEIQFYYLVNGYKPLSNILQTLDGENFMTIMANLFANVLSVKSNGFLSCQNIDISFEKIYIDPNTYKTMLVYLPISRKLFSDEAAFENELRTSLVKLISSVSALSSPKTLQFMSDLSNGMLSMKALYDGIKGGKSSRSSGHMTSGNEHNGTGNHLRIVALNAPERVEVEVTKDNFVIGKNPASADGVISFNKMISRIHCRITRENGKYMITDLQSANGTYVNRNRLAPNSPQMIQNGDVIRLANSDFQVVIN